MSPRRVRTVALTVLLACVAARPLLSELFYEIPIVMTPAGTDAGASGIHAKWANPSLLVRVALAGALLTAAALVILADARDGAIEVRRPWLIVLIAAFALLSLLSTLFATDRRSAWTAWVEQVSLMAACLTAARLCRRRSARDLVLAAVAAACIVLVVKSVWQVAVEFPSNRDEWRQHSADILRKGGYTPGSMNARLLEKRMLAGTPSGFGGLANPFASMMIVLSFTTAALAVERIAAARADRKAANRGKSRDLHLPTTAAVLITTLAAAGFAVILLTHSRGAIVAMVLAALAGAGVYRFRNALKRRRRRAMVVVAGLALVAAAAVLAHGMTHDSLPTRTMTFRWYYWSGAARIVGESPGLGAGPGNFANAYLRHRRIEAEEEIKAPHNVAVHALSQYGLGGGLCFVAIVTWVLAAAARPGETEQIAADEPPGRPTLGTRPMILAAVALALAGRWLFHDPAGGPIMLMLDTILPVVVLAGALVLARWRGGAEPRCAALPAASRILLVCGLVGFVLHNGVTFSMWMPGPALVFWTVAGLCMSQSPAGRSWRLTERGAAVAGWAMVLLALSAAFWFGLPTSMALTSTRTMARQVNAGNLAGAMESARAAAEADEACVTTALDAAKLARHASATAPSPDQARRRLREALRWAEATIERDATDARGHMTAADALIRLGTGQDRRDALNHLARATSLDPRNMRYRLYYASVLLDAGRKRECLVQLRQALHTDAKLPHEGRQGGSPMRLSGEEMDHVTEMWQRAGGGPLP